MTDFVQKVYFVCFRITHEDHDKSWTLHIVFKGRVEYEQQWTDGCRKSMKFDLPMV